MDADPAVPAVIKKYEREILELKQELAMHDALTDRHQISYGQYSEAQKAEVRAQVTQFLQEDSSSDSLDPLQLISLRHVREVLLAARVSGQHHACCAPHCFKMLWPWTPFSELPEACMLQFATLLPPAGAASARAAQPEAKRGGGDPCCSRESYPHARR